VLQAAQAAAKRREMALSEGRSLAFETVFSAEDKVQFLRAARRKGYFARLFFVATSDPAINAARVARRVMQGGHDVPIGKIIARYFKSIANCAAVASEVDRLYLYDNSEDGREPKLVVRVSEGCIVKSYAPTLDWMKAIIDGLTVLTGPR
jgi:predicted ABC-type ATPase